jgi:hypothetical protein
LRAAVVAYQPWLNGERRSFFGADKTRPDARFETFETQATDIQLRWKARQVPDLTGRMALFFLAGLHTHLVFGLACRSGIILHASLLLIATDFTGVRLLRLYRARGDTHSEHHQCNNCRNSHLESFRMKFLNFVAKDFFLESLTNLVPLRFS